MNKERLTNLALLHVNYGVSYDYDKLVDIFATKHPRGLELEWPLKVTT